MMRPPVEKLVPVLTLAEAEAMRAGIVDLRVLKEPRRSISMTVLKALEERPVRGERKLPAAPALRVVSMALVSTTLQKYKF